MNKDLFESKWQQIRSQSNGWWSLITDYDLGKVAKEAVKFDKYLTMPQVKYDYPREQVKKVVKRVAEQDAEQKSSVRSA